MENAITYTPEDIKAATERLAVSQAVLKVASEACNTRDGYNRLAVDEMLLNMHENFGADRLELQVGDEKVGALSLTTKEHAIIDDYDALRDWQESCGYSREIMSLDFDLLRPDTRARIAAIARMDNPLAITTRREYVDVEQIAKPVGTDMVTESGEVVPGVHYGREITGTRISGCNPRDVTRALRLAEGDSAMTYFLSEGVKE